MLFAIVPALLHFTTVGVVGSLVWKSPRYFPRLLYIRNLPLFHPCAHPTAYLPAFGYRYRDYPDWRFPHRQFWIQKLGWGIERLY